MAHTPNTGVAGAEHDFLVEPFLKNKKQQRIDIKNNVPATRIEAIRNVIPVAYSGALR